MEQFRVGFIFLKKEKILSYMKSEKTTDRSRRSIKKFKEKWIRAP